MTQLNVQIVNPEQAPKPYISDLKPGTVFEWSNAIYRRVENVSSPYGSSKTEVPAMLLAQDHGDAYKRGWVAWFPAEYRADRVFKSMEVNLQ